MGLITSTPTSFCLQSFEQFLGPRAVDLLGPLGQVHVVVGLEDEVQLARLDQRLVLGRHVQALPDEANLALLLELLRGGLRNRRSNRYGRSSSRCNRSGTASGSFRNS